MRELEERELDGLDEAGHLLEGEEPPWQTVKSKRRSREPASIPKSRRQKIKKGTTITLGEVRRTQNRPISSSRRPQATAVDPWNQLSSLCTHIASLLPPNPPSFFQSFFHSPDHRTPYDALIAALSTLCANDVDSDHLVNSLPVMLDILLPSYESLDSELRSRLISEIQLALKVTHGRGDDTLDLVGVLRDLDQDFATDRLELGIYHSPVHESPPKMRPTQPPPSASPPSHTTIAQPPPTARQKVDPSEWQYVPHRKASRNGPDRLPASTPDCNTGVLNTNLKNEVPRARSLSQAQQHRRRIRERMGEMNDLLLQASEAWKRGNSKTRGGEVASYYAQRVSPVPFRYESPKYPPFDHLRCTCRQENLTMLPGKSLWRSRVSWLNLSGTYITQSRVHLLTDPRVAGLHLAMAVSIYTEPLQPRPS